MKPFSFTGKIALFVTLGIAGMPSMLTTTLAEESVPCIDTAPLLRANWDTFPVEGDTTLGTWQLPVSASQPDLLTEARLQASVSISPSAMGPGQCQLHLLFSFPDPKPYGIPFSFQKVRFTWNAPAPRSLELDWSDNCQGVGRSLFPGQSWSLSVEIPHESGAQAPCEFSDPELLLWGSRN